MYQQILLAYDCEEKFETIIQELNKLTGAPSTEDESKDVVITVLVVIPQPKLETSIIYDNKHFEETVKEERIKFKPFLEDLKLNGFNYETKFISGDFKEEVLREIQTDKYEIAILCNRKLKLKRKDVFGDPLTQNY